MKQFMLIKIKLTKKTLIATVKQLMTDLPAS